MSEAPTLFGMDIVKRERYIPRKQYKQFAIDMLEDLARMGDEKNTRYVLKERTKRMGETVTKESEYQKNLHINCKSIAAMQEKKNCVI